jgi:hypothetical protein
MKTVMTNTNREIEMKPYRTQKQWLTKDLLHRAPTAEFCQVNGANGAQLEHPLGGPLTWVRCPHANAVGVTRKDDKWYWLIAEAPETTSNESTKVMSETNRPVGETSYMPGTNGFTMAVFNASDVPVGSKLYLSAQPELTVWEGAMPESNGKSNFTAMLVRKGAASLIEGISEGFTIARSEYPDRVRYEADRVRHLIGELAEKPCILDYDADKHSGYAEPK